MFIECSRQSIWTSVNRKVMSITNMQVGEEQCGFRDDSEYVDQSLYIEDAGKEIFRKQTTEFKTVKY